MRAGTHSHLDGPRRTDELKRNARVRACVQGGYYNKVKGRFGTVLGGTHNQALGRHSLAVGYYAVASGDNSAAFGFSGSDCVVTDESAVKFCVDEFLVNGKDLVAQVEASRRRLSQGSSGSAVEAATTAARLEGLKTLVALQQEELAELSGVREEQTALLAEVEALEVLMTERLLGGVNTV